MFIDNQPATSKWTLAEVLMPLLGAGLLLLTHLESMDKLQHNLCYGLGAAGLIAAAAMLIVNPSYVYYSDEGKNIVIRTCSAFPLFRKYREYPFPKKSLAGFKIESRIFGLQKLLHITVTGKDPATGSSKNFEIEKINISALKKDSIESLERALGKILGK